MWGWGYCWGWLSGLGLGLGLEIGLGLGLGDGARAVGVPTRPKTEAEAPTERTSGRKTTDTIVPKIPESTYRLPMRHEPKLRSSGTWGGHRRRDRQPWVR